MSQSLENKYQKYLDRWGDTNWKIAGDRTVKTCLKYYEKWFGKKPTRILDVGCMNGYVMDAFIRSGYDAWGLEPNDFYKYSIYPKKIFNIPLHELKNEKFDFIFCSEVMEHIPEEFVESSLIALRNALTGATFLTISENMDADPTHVTIHERNWWLEKMGKAGLTYHPDKKAMKGFNFYCLT